MSDVAEDYRTLLEIVEDECETDAEFAKRTAALAATPANKRRAALDAMLWLVCTSRPPTASRRLTAVLVSASKRALRSGDTEFLRRPLERIARWGTRKAAIDARRASMLRSEVVAGGSARWITATTHVLVCEGREADDKALCVGITPTASGMWNVLAVEAPRSALQGGAASLFDNHAHDAIAEDVPEAEGRALAEAYVEKWIAGMPPATPCACGEIGLVTPVAMH